MSQSLPFLICPPKIGQHLVLINFTEYVVLSTGHCLISALIAFAKSTRMFFELYSQPNYCTLFSGWGQMFQQDILCNLLEIYL